VAARVELLFTALKLGFFFVIKVLHLALCPPGCVWLHRAAQLKPGLASQSQFCCLES